MICCALTTCIWHNLPTNLVHVCSSCFESTTANVHASTIRPCSIAALCVISINLLLCNLSIPKIFYNPHRAAIHIWQFCSDMIKLTLTERLKTDRPHFLIILFTLKILQKMALWTFPQRQSPSVPLYYAEALELYMENESVKAQSITKLKLFNLRLPDVLPTNIFFY